MFLGPGGAQYNVPQMYWKDIGTTTDAVFAHTYAYNLIYQRPIFPLGQVYSNPPAHQIVRFRELSRCMPAPGPPSRPGPRNPFRPSLCPADIRFCGNKYQCSR